MRRVGSEAVAPRLAETPSQSDPPGAVGETYGPLITSESWIDALDEAAEQRVLNNLCGTNMVDDAVPPSEGLLWAETLNVDLVVAMRDD